MAEMTHCSRSVGAIRFTAQGASLPLNFAAPDTGRWRRAIRGFHRAKGDY
jgi:hypothetical protein